MNAEARKKTETSDDDDDDDDSMQIEIVDDDAPPAKDPEERGAAESDDGLPDDDEVQTYSKRVQDRIKELSRRQHDERRRAERAEEVSREMMTHLQRQQAALERYRTLVASGEKDLVDTSKSRSQVELEAAKNAYAKAFEAGDADQVAEAQARMAKAAADHAKWEGYRLQHQAPPKQEQSRQQAPVPPQPPRQQADPEKTRRLSEWQSKNPWFNSNQDLTDEALKFHTRLVRDGVDVGSKEYFDKIDSSMKQYLNPGGDTRQRSPGNSTVAPMARAQPGSRTKFKLTQRQVDLAKKFGLTNEQYARELMRLEKGE